MNTKRSSALLISLFLTGIAVVAQQASFQIDPSAEKLRQHVSYLASDQLEGRRTGTSGADEAARYIATEFKRLGLNPLVQPTTKPKNETEAKAWYLQSFPYVAAVDVGGKNQLEFTPHSASQAHKLRLKEQWIPLGFSSNGSVAAPVEFVGFGI